MMTGKALFTISVTVATAVVKSVTSVGVNVTERICAPPLGIVPAIGEYTNVPAVLAVASSCVAVSAVPKVIAAGVAHVITGVAKLTVRTPLTKVNE